jgi:hypothetical protein
MTGSTKYAIVVTMDGTDASNYAELEYSTATSIPSGVATTWNASKAEVLTVPGSQTKMVIYTND